MTLELQGLIVPAITPRIDAGVDLSSLTNLLEFLIEGGVDSIFILGTTGEFQHLSLDEKAHIIRASSDCIRNRVEVLAGISATSIDEMLMLIKTSEECRTQALVLAPMFGQTSPLELVGTALQNSSLPIVLYNNPAIQEGAELPISFVAEFVSNPKVIGMKDSSGNREYFHRLLELQSPDFRIVQGKETTILESLEAGAAGIVAGAANVAPALFKSMMIQRDQETMDRIMALKSELKQYSPASIAAIKQKLVRLGIITSAALFRDI